MAERRMFARQIADSDAFLDMPLTAQALYFHLGMRADDEGFVNGARKIARMIGASDDDLRILIAKRFLIAFDSGVVVVKHWRLHNYIRADRLRPTAYREERAQLQLKENGAYTMCQSSDRQLTDKCQSTVSQVTVNCPSSDGVGKDSIGEYRIAEDRREGEGTTRKRFVPPTLDEVAAFVQEIGGKVDPQRFLDYYTSNGWMVGRNHMRDWKATVRRWAREDGKTGKAPATAPKPSALTAQDYTQRQYAGDMINLFEDDEGAT